ncbi:MAG: hypothetical protein QXI58_07200, partial [Candidatus Micrarchaeia archaeon]
MKIFSKFVERRPELLKKLEFHASALKNLYFLTHLHAYQPRANKKIFTKFEIDEKNLCPEVEERMEKIKNKNKLSFFDKAVITSYVPLIHVAEKFPGALTIDFPQVTLDEIKNFYPKFYEKLIEMNKKDIIEIAASSYHHAIPQMLSDEDILYEYVYPLSMEQFDGEDVITFHFPEQAINKAAFKALSNYAWKKDILITVILDSMHHNPGSEIRAYTKYYEDKIRLGILFRNNFFSNWVAFSLADCLNYNSIEDSAIIMFENLVNSIFVPYYYEKLKRGEEKLYFLLSVDAETFGMHIKNSIEVLENFLSLVKLYMNLSTVRNYSFICNKIYPANILFDKSWSVDLCVWFINETKSLREKIKEIRINLYD